MEYKLMTKDQVGPNGDRVEIQCSLCGLLLHLNVGQKVIFPLVHLKVGYEVCQGSINNLKVRAAGKHREERTAIVELCFYGKLSLIGEVEMGMKEKAF